MRKIITITLLLCLLTTPCHALTLFDADYDADEWTEERVEVDYPSAACGDSSILRQEPPNGGCAAKRVATQPDKGSQYGGNGGEWLPLRALSEILPYTVDWSDRERTIYIYADRTWTIHPDRWIPEGVQIVDGVTWVTPAYLRRFLPGISFLYDGELYVLRGETRRSELVRGSEDFRAHTLTVLYRLKLALPQDYKLIRRYLTGGVEQREKTLSLPLTTRAYIYPAFRRPTAYIIDSDATGCELAELIAHEAYHVHLERWNKQSEDRALAYGRRVKQELLETTYQNEVNPYE